jgi:hypothetical protein
MSVRSLRVVLSWTPSATTVIPRLCPRSTAERTITALSGSFAMPITKERSIFSSLTGKVLRYDMHE